MALKSRPILSSRYQPRWGPWEAFRELKCNSIDADPSGHIVDISSAGSVATFYTRQAPTLAQLSIIGEGTKDADSGTIGQFGEGFKLAACTVLRLGGSCSVRCPTYTATFSLKAEEGASAPVLYINPRTVPPSQSKPGCLITLTLPNADWSQYLSRFCDPALEHLPRAKDDTTRVFCKGVFITNIARPALHDYNLTLTLNRDRSMPDHYSLLCAIACSLTASDALPLLTTRAHLEHDALDNYHFYTTASLRNALFKEYRSRYGDKAVLPSPNPIVNEAATLRGYVVAPVSCSGIEYILIGLGVKRAEEVTFRADGLTRVPSPPIRDEAQTLINLYSKRLSLAQSPALAWHSDNSFLLTEDSGEPTLWLPSTCTTLSQIVACYLGAVASSATPPGSLTNGSFLAYIAAQLLTFKE